MRRGSKPSANAILLCLVFFAQCSSRPPLSPTRPQLYLALLDAHVLAPDRQLVSFSHVCTLQIDGDEYPVVDLGENVRSDTSPRGVRQIIVFDARWKPTKQIECGSHRPLFCVQNRLFVDGDLTIDNLLPEGNVLTFSDHGRVAVASHVEAHAYPIPITRDRSSAPQ
jgi:hypothetical protein